MASPTPTKAPVVLVPQRRARPQPTPTPNPAPSVLISPRTLPKGEVEITDRGIFPRVLAVMAGGTVTWTNIGSLVHTATGVEASGAKLDSGGLAAGQSYSLALFDPGTYRYTSAPDCLGASNGSGFDCSGASIKVIPPVVPALSAPHSAAAIGLFAPPAVAVQITDSGFVPDHVVVKADGWITWTNQGSAVHTATGAAQLFDTGGLAPHQSGQVRFQTPGIFTYTSAPDCLNGNRGAIFNCSAPFTITVWP